VRGYNPGAVAGANGHHTPGRIDKLISIVKMQRDDVPCGVIVRVCRDLGVAISRRIKHRPLALLRHSLSQYRKYADQASANLSAEIENGRWVRLNRLHEWLCRSARWRKTIQQRVPWVVSGAELGHNVLELGPGPGLTTDLLRLRVGHITAIEVDPKLAESLRSRMRGSNVEVVAGDATVMPFADSQFSGSVSFTMLHHVPSPELQDKLLREVWRVLKPGGAFVGSDSLQSLFMRVIHIGDTLVPIAPDTFGVRLEEAGFEVLELEKCAGAFRFHARKPAARWAREQQVVS
jgi:SAM-dependent methyltransferase